MNSKDSKRKSSEKQKFTFVVYPQLFSSRGGYIAYLGDGALIGTGETPADAIRDWLVMHEDSLEVK